jgi:hypothetical protein
VRSADPQFVVHSNADIVIYLVCSVDVGSIGRTTYKLLSCDCVRVASQDPEEELAASNLPTIYILSAIKVHFPCIFIYMFLTQFELSVDIIIPRTPNPFFIYLLP